MSIDLGWPDPEACPSWAIYEPTYKNQEESAKEEPTLEVIAFETTTMEELAMKTYACSAIPRKIYFREICHERATPLKSFHGPGKICHGKCYSQSMPLIEPSLSKLVKKVLAIEYFVIEEAYHRKSCPGNKLLRSFRFCGIFHRIACPRRIFSNLVCLRSLKKFWSSKIITCLFLLILVLNLEELVYRLRTSLWQCCSQQTTC